MANFIKKLYLVLFNYNYIYIQAQTYLYKIAEQFK